MIPLLGTVLSQARTLLNDDDGTIWTDPRLIPKAQQAFNHMQAELLLAGIPIINSVSTIMTVNSISIDDNNVDLSVNANYPTDMIMPIWMKERRVGEHNVDFADMQETDFVPNVDLAQDLRYWSWTRQKIMLRGATTTKQVQLRYQCLLTMPNVNTDNTQLILSELYLSWKTAGFAAFSAGDMDKAAALDSKAEANIYKLVQMNVKQLQNLPARRKAYHRSTQRSTTRSF